MVRLNIACLLLMFATAVPFATAQNNEKNFLGVFNLQGNPFESVPEMEKRVKKWVNSGVKLALPYMMKTMTEVKISSECAGGLLKLVRDIMDIKDWAFRMLDALGKPSAGILEGTAMALGDYDECLDIKVDDDRRKRRNPVFWGKYCMVQINLPEALRQAAIEYQAGNRSQSVLANSKTFLRTVIKIAPRADIADLRVGVCIPSTCTVDDLQALINEIVKFIKIEARTLRCEMKQPLEFTLEQMIVLGIIGVISLLVCAGTALEIFVHFKYPGDVEAISAGKKKIKGRHLLIFSLGSNTRKLLQLRLETSEKISSIRGMKAITVCLYVVVSTYASPHDFHFLKYRSAFHMYKFMEEWWFTAFANASAGVDTLFVVAGLQVTYTMWKKYGTGPNGKIKINSLKFLVIWFTRLAMIQLLVIGLFMCLPLAGNGPIWADVVTPEVDKCRTRWWMNVLFINSFWPSNETCLTHSWIVSAMMHLLLITPLLLYVLSRWSAFGIILLITLILGSSVAIAIVTMINDLPPAPAFYFLSFLNLGSIWDKLFTQAYDHLSPFCVGILLGYYMTRTSKVRLSKTIVVTGWVLAGLCNMTVLCGLYGYRHGESMDTTLSAVYASVHRLAWSLGIAWTVFACAYGYGGVINSILSWKVFIPLDRLANLVYLLSPLILYLHGGQLRERMYMAHIDQAMYATAYIVFTIAFAALCYITCYSPFLHIESIIWNTKTHFSSSSFTNKRKQSDNFSEISGKFKNQVTRCDMVFVNVGTETLNSKETNSATHKNKSVDTSDHT